MRGGIPPWMLPLMPLHLDILFPTTLYVYFYCLLNFCMLCANLF